MEYFGGRNSQAAGKRNGPSIGHQNQKKQWRGMMA